MFRGTLLTVFPSMFPGPLGQSLAGDALTRRVWALDVRDIREHGLGPAPRGRRHARTAVGLQFDFAGVIPTAV